VLLSVIGRLLLPALDFVTVYLLTSGLPRHLQQFRRKLETHLFWQSYGDIVLLLRRHSSPLSYSYLGHYK